MKTEDISHLRWMHDRFIYVYGENQDVDYLIKLRSIIAELEVLQHHKNNCDTCKWDEYCGTEENCLSSKYIKDRYEPKLKEQ